MKCEIAYLRSWRFHRVFEHLWPGSNSRKSFWNSEIAPLEKLKNLYVSLRRGPWRVWIWLRDLEWMETSIRAFRAHLLKATVSSNNWTSHLKVVHLLHDREFECVIAHIVKGSINIMSPFRLQSSPCKKAIILIIICPAAAAVSSLQSVVCRQPDASFSHSNSLNQIQTPHCPPYMHTHSNFFIKEF